MDKFFRFTGYMGIFILFLLFIWLFVTFMMPKVNIQMPSLSEELPKKLLPVSPVNPVDVGNKLTDTITYTLESSTIDFWVYFDFSKGSVVPDVKDFKSSLNWDIAFRRAKMASNGGGTNKKGRVAIAKLNTADFDSVTSVPDDIIFTQDTKTSPGADPKNINLDKWYSYNFMDHYLKPHKNVYIVKTAEGNYAKMQILDYYCKKGDDRVTGCYTLKYVYQGDGSKSFGNAVSQPLKSQMKKTDIVN